MKAILKYPGSKWRIADWVISFFPEHHSYLEPFFGSGATLFQKKPSNIETINDLDGGVVNFFEWVRRDPERLARAVFLTPYGRRVYDAAFAPAENNFDAAVKFCIQANMGYGFRTAGARAGWKFDIQGRERAYSLNDWNELPEQIILAAERLKHTQIDASLRWM